MATIQIDGAQTSSTGAGGGSEAAGSDWTADGIDLSTLVDLGTIDATFAWAATKLSADGVLSGQLAANGNHGWSIAEVAAGADFEVAAQVSQSWPNENMNDGSRASMIGVVFFEYDDGTTFDLTADSYDGVGIRQASSVTSFEYGNPNATDLGAFQNFHDGATSYQGIYSTADLVLVRSGGTITGYAYADGVITRITTPSAALGNGAGRIAIIARKTNAETGAWVNVHAVRTADLSIDEPHLVTE